MTLPEILKAVRQWWWILIICPVIAAGTAYFVSSLLTPMYESEATVIVEHQLAGGALDLQSIQAAERRTQTFSQLISTRSVTQPVIDELDLDVTAEDFRSNLSISHVTNTQLISISYQDPNPALAAEIVNLVAAQFGEYVREIQVPIVGLSEDDLDEAIAGLDEQIEAVDTSIAEIVAAGGPESEEEEVRLAALENTLGQLQQTREALAAVEETLSGFDATVGSQVYVAEPASPPTDPVSPRTMLNVALAGMLGLLLGGGLTVVAAWLDDKIKTEHDLRELFDRPVVGAVPLEALPNQVEDAHSGRSLSGEIFRGLRTNLQFTMIDRDVKSLVVTSMFPGEGKTTVAANLAIVLAQGGQRVILVDADLRRPRVHSMFHRVRNDRGLSNLLLHSPAVIEEVVQSTTVKNLKVLASGPLPPNPPDLLGSLRMKALVAALEDTADIVIFDAPPLVISESLLLSSLVDGLLFVVRANSHRTAELVEGYETASQAGAPILGFVLNGVRPESQAAARVYQQYYPLVEDDGEIVTRQKRGWFRRLVSRS
jgi:polysaccharide biosynthesis transport protein